VLQVQWFVYFQDDYMWILLKIFVIRRKKFKIKEFFGLRRGQSCREALLKVREGQRENQIREECTGWVAFLYGNLSRYQRRSKAASTLYISEASKLSSNGLSFTQQRCVAQPQNWETIQQVVRAERPSHCCWEGNQVELHWLACYCRGWVGCATASTAASVKTEKMRGAAIQSTTLLQQPQLAAEAFSTAQQPLLLSMKTPSPSDLTEFLWRIFWQERKFFVFYRVFEKKKTKRMESNCNSKIKK